MKKITKLFIIFLAAVLSGMCFASCKASDNLPEKNKSAGLWDNATYLDDTEIGEGEKAFIFEVKAEEKSVKFTVHTDEKTVGDALLKYNLISGDMGDFGLYVKTVNGIFADYDKTKSYWLFYINGEYAMTGATETEISQGAEYKFEYTK